MDLGIDGRVAIVVGGSKGLGRTTAQVLAAEGARVVVAARTAADVDDAVAAIVEAGGQAAGVAGDMTRPEGVGAAMGVATEAFGATPDIAVSTMRPEVTAADPGGGGDGDFDEVGPDAFLRGYETSVVAWALLAAAVAPGMRARRWGRLVNVCSGAVKEPPRELHHVVGNTARAGVVTLGKSLANELGPYGITVNTIGTGLFDSGHPRSHFAESARRRGQDPAEFEAEWCRTQIPISRPGRAEEMAAVCAFLCSEGAGYLTGQFIAVDGGYARSAW